MTKTESILSAMSEIGDADHYQISQHLGWGIGKTYATLQAMSQDGTIEKSKRGRTMFYKLVASVKTKAKKLEKEDVPTNVVTDLVGRMLHFPFDPLVRRNRCGWYLGRVLRVITWKRTGKIRFVVVGISDPETGGFTKKVKLHPSEFAAKRASLDIDGKRIHVDGHEIGEQSVRSKR